jgi:hypothetical protein
MTSRLPTTRATASRAETPTPTGLSGAISPEQFAAASAEIARQPKTEKSHREMDALCMATLRSLGFGDGCEIFEQFTRGYHGG